MRRLLLSLLVLTFTLPALAQAKHPFTFEDMMKLKRVGDPQVSPDGKWVLFSVVDVDLEANTKTPHIWIVPTAGGQEKEIIADQDADRPRWAPDGKHFAFVSTKEAGSQVWIAEFNYLDGTVTGVHRLTSIATEASGELWSPDGKNILFTSDVYPECDGHGAVQIIEFSNPNLRSASFVDTKAKCFPSGAQRGRSALIGDDFLFLTTRRGDIQMCGVLVLASRSTSTTLKGPTCRRATPGIAHALQLRRVFECEGMLDLSESGKSECENEKGEEKNMKNLLRQTDEFSTSAPCHPEPRFSRRRTCATFRRYRLCQRLHRSFAAKNAAQQ